MLLRCGKKNFMFLRDPQFKITARKRYTASNIKSVSDRTVHQVPTRGQLYKHLHTNFSFLYKYVSCNKDTFRIQALESELNKYSL
jgi:hypothetical protein